MTDWGIIDRAPNAGAAVMQGFGLGQQQAKAANLDKALRYLGQNPNDQQAMSTVMSIDPDLGLKYQLTAAKRQEQAVAQQIGGMAAGGDIAGARTAALQGGQFDLVKTLDGLGAPDKEAVKRRTDYIGNAALAIKQLPLEQRPAAWRQYALAGKQYGVEGLEAFADSYSEQSLDAAIAQAGMVKDYFETQKVDWKVIPEGGRIDAFDSMGRPLAPPAPPVAPAAPAQVDAATLQAQAEAAIAAGADPAAVRARLQQMLGGGGPAPAPSNFP